MRPVRLEMRGFTAFRDPTEIDFTDLDLFALWGPMGSGKSSVLDAMTYALYGKVERIGSSMSQLVSQGQPRMSVLFEFDVAEQRYRITRSTPAKGSTKVLFERHDGSDWKSHGEGADRAREVNKTLTDLIGLDYPAFTRAVLLPQGKFAEFLTGDAADRRKILTELLGLELFGRMAGIARSIADQAKADVGARLSLLDQYADVDDDAVKEADAGAAAAKTLAAEAGSIEKKLEGFGKRGDELDKKVEALTECSQEAVEVAEQLEAEALSLQGLAQAATGYASQVEEAKKVAESAHRAHKEAKAEIDRAAELWGKLDELVETRRLVEALVSARNELATTESSVKDAEAALKKARGQESEARASLEKVTSSVAEAEHAEKEQAVRLELANKADLVGSLTHDLTKGDPCPVCDRPLERIPKGDAFALKKAKEEHGKAIAAASAARESKNTKQTAMAVAEADVRTATQQLSRCTEEKARRAAKADDLATQVETAFKAKIPKAVETVIEERIVATRGLITEETARAKEHEHAATAQSALEREAASITEKTAAAKGAITAAPLNACVRRAAKVAPETEKIALPKSLPDTPEGLAEVATSAATDLRRLASDLEKARATTMEERAALSDAALEVMAPILDDGVPVPAGDVTDLIASFRNLVRDLEKGAATAAETARSVRADLDKRKALEKEVAEKKNVDATYRALAKELRGDHLVDHLQSEALVALAAAGSVRLTYLSAGRYRLSYESDEFFVIDGWNGEERRSVRTLSGGETFLASLALALALSDEVKNLAVTDRAPIESLFLDEGFGSLDAETLDTVVSAVEQLGGDGRMVGVITHVADVAERLPVKLVVTKSPRGSRIEREIQGAIELVG